MICKFCGNVIEDNSDFCFICGQKLPNEGGVEAPEESNDVFSQPQEEAVAVEEKEAVDVQENSEAVAADEIAVAPGEANVTAPAAPDAPVYDSTAPIYAQSTPIYAQTAPVYTQQVIIQHVQAPTVTKTKSEKDPSIATKACKVFAAIFSATFILQFISWIWYKNAKKAGYEKKSIDILNSTMIGLCIFLGVLCLVFIKTFMLA